VTCTCCSALSEWQTSEQPFQTRTARHLCHFVQVFDGTKFLPDHPGGAESILMAGGVDATDDFNAVHSDAAKQQLRQFYIAEMAPEGVKVCHATQALGSRLGVHSSHLRKLALSCGVRMAARSPAHLVCCSAPA
jgi:Cytochrome b5-like Heme/Steroid binding domain